MDRESLHTVLSVYSQRNSASASPVVGGLRVSVVESMKISQDDINRDQIIIRSPNLNADSNNLLEIPP